MEGMEEEKESQKHIPVLLQESIGYLLNGRKTGIYIDATLGGGGSSKRILEQLDCTGKVMGIDQDPAAIEISTERLQFYPNFTAVRENFRDLERILEGQKIDGIDGIIFDLGVSSMQLADPSRGFSFRTESLLDMRMDPTRTRTTALDLLKNYDVKDLRKLFREFGEERWAGRIASIIAAKRQETRIETTAQLVELIVKGIPRKFHSRRIHPATRFFQALRIAVNEELESLEEGLNSAIEVLKGSGRVVVISYHSLEDRIVKNIFKKKSMEGFVRIITKKPLTPSEEEINSNPRSRSAKMRIAEKN
jgi:16S rRNA (cytosine1402-N4)-methyltransferase